MTLTIFGKTVDVYHVLNTASDARASCFLIEYLTPKSVQVDVVFEMPVIPSSIGEIVTAAKIVHSIYKALSDSMGASYDYQCLIAELRSFEQALKTVELAITFAHPTGSDALNIAAETTTCVELLKRFDDRIRSYQKALGGRKGASWRKIGWSLFKAEEVASFRQRISQHKHNITLFLNGLTM